MLTASPCAYSVLSAPRRSLHRVCVRGAAGSCGSTSPSSICRSPSPIIYSPRRPAAPSPSRRSRCGSACTRRLSHTHGPCTCTSHMGMARGRVHACRYLKRKLSEPKKRERRLSVVAAWDAMHSAPFVRDRATPRTMHHPGAESVRRPPLTSLHGACVPAGARPARPLPGGPHAPHLRGAPRPLPAAARPGPPRETRRPREVRYRVERAAAPPP